MSRAPERFHRRSIRLKGFDYRTPGLYVVTICTQHRVSLLGEIVDGAMHLSPAGVMVQTVWDELPWAYPGVEIDAFVVIPNHVHGIVFLLPDGTTDFDGDAGNGEQGQAQGQGQPRGVALATGDDRVGATPRGCPSSNNDPFRQGDRADDRVGAPPRGCPSSEDSPPEITNRPPSENGPAHDSTPPLSLPDVVHRFKTLTTHRYGEGVRNLGWEPYPGRLWQRNYYEHIVRNERDLDRFRRYIDENPIRWSTDRHNPTFEG